MSQCRGLNQIFAVCEEILSRVTKAAASDTIQMGSAYSNLVSENITHTDPWLWSAHIFMRVSVLTTGLSVASWPLWPILHSVCERLKQTHEPGYRRPARYLHDVCLCPVLSSILKNCSLDCKGVLRVPNSNFGWRNQKWTTGSLSLSPHPAAATKP